MTKFTVLFIAATMPLLADGCSATGSDRTMSMTAAQPRDVAYCQVLVDKYTTYVGSVDGSLGGTADHGIKADLDAKVAIAQCQEGNTGPAIPVLEQKLREAGVAVPPRTT
jgi:hypothetical protein